MNFKMDILPQLVVLAVFCLVAFFFLMGEADEYLQRRRRQYRPIEGFEPNRTTEGVGKRLEQGSGCDRIRGRSRSTPHWRRNRRQIARARCQA